ncbi:type IV pilus modification PilV family protein [Scleromatobacter humisilvae]|uniref:Prepilin-type N-terminal cleavage/methylation domain-containing protein n=1 Tax=Scleromatobacter humisilvae TaxID=2897159 RepID=A0A9X2C3M9_9BURK|nr:prepilin-type N-terminal cleavage/methylation domain-containing protein [Scleromatobacter humisilvae]MCK9688504.1 prepilin-type N-terminal cleavage/methylation domain-containing protein [Scleromatobacter humisilvae]
MNRHPFKSRRARRGQRGFTLITVLIAIFLFGFGLLAILRSLGNVTGGATQNQIVATTATISNGFWGVVQANPSIVTSSALLSGGTAVTFTSANITSAPAALQPWLYSLTDTSSNGLPSGTAKIETWKDPVTGAACSASACAITLTLTWASSKTTTRTQVFYYQLGL